MLWLSVAYWNFANVVSNPLSFFSLFSRISQVHAKLTPRACPTKQNAVAVVATTAQKSRFGCFVCRTVFHKRFFCFTDRACVLIIGRRTKSRLLRLHLPASACARPQRTTRHHCSTKRKTTIFGFIFRNTAAAIRQIIRRLLLAPLRIQRLAIWPLLLLLLVLEPQFLQVVLLSSQKQRNPRRQQQPPPQNGLSLLQKPKVRLLLCCCWLLLAPLLTLAAYRAS